jgi:hypothetical protein
MSTENVQNVVGITLKNRLSAFGTLVTKTRQGVAAFPPYNYSPVWLDGAEGTGRLTPPATTDSEF